MADKKDLWELVVDKATKYLKTNAKTDVDSLLAKAGEFVAKAG